LPEFLFQGATLTFRPSKGISDFKVEFPEQENEARSDSEGISQQNTFQYLIDTQQPKNSLVSTPKEE